MSQWNPADYHQHSSHQQKWAQDVLPKLHLAGHEDVLDIGCGDGKVTAQIAQAVPRGSVVGIDLAPEMVQFAQQHFPMAEHPNLRFQQLDARSLDFVGQFDLAVSFACLHWLIDHRPLLAGIFRSLRQGGRAVLQFGGKGNAADVVQAVSDVTRQPRWAGYFSGFAFPWGFYSPDDYRPWLEKAGFRTVRLELVPKDMVHQGPAGLAGWLRTTWMPYVQRVPAELQQAFLDEAVAAYLDDHPADKKGGVHLSMMRLEVEALKP